MAKQNKIDYQATVDSLAANNSTGDISESDVRTLYKNLSDSVLHLGAVESLGEDPTSWNVNNFTAKGGSCTATTNLSIEVINTQNQGEYYLRVINLPSNKTTIAIDGTTDGTTAVYSSGNNSSLTLYGDTTDEVLVFIKRINLNLFVSQVGLDVLDQDDMSSNSARAVPTQQSVKAYVDNLQRPPVENSYSNESAMFADQGNQTADFIQEVTTGESYYVYLGTTNGNSTDYNDITTEYNASDDVQSYLENIYKLFKTAEGLTLKDKNNGDAVIIDQNGSMSFPAAEIATINFESGNGNNFVALNQNLADALSFISGALKFFQFDTTTGSEKIKTFQTLEMQTPIEFIELDTEPATPPTGSLYMYGWNGQIRVKDDTGSTEDITAL